MQLAWLIAWIPKLDGKRYTIEDFNPLLGEGGKTTMTKEEVDLTLAKMRDKMSKKELSIEEIRAKAEAYDARRR